MYQNVDHFFETVKDGSYETVGYTKSAYGNSKLAINAFVNVLAHEQPIIDKNIQVYGLCPGYVNTDMTSGKGPLTIQQGA